VFLLQGGKGILFLFPFLQSAAFPLETVFYFCFMTAEQSLFFDACRQGDLATVEQLYHSDHSLVNITDVRGFTPLIIAVYNNEVAVTDFLLHKGAAVDAQDASGNTAMMGAGFKGYIALIKRLLDAGANVNQRNFQGATALTFAATFGQLEIAELLLQNGADLNVTDVRGKSPLAHAIIQENEAMIALLEKYQALSISSNGAENKGH
jgi:ankyrin repeat protein